MNRVCKIIITLGIIGLIIALIITLIMTNKNFIPNDMTNLNTKSYLDHNLKNLVQYKNIKKYINQDPYDKVNIPLYYINMDKSEDRKIILEKQLKDLNIKLYTRIRAVPGNKLKSINFGFFDNYTYINYYNDLSVYELGCTLSHIIAIKTAKEDNRDIALIIEDDVLFILMPYWPYDLKSLIDKAPNDWEIIQLFTINGKIGGKNYFIKHDSQTPGYSTLAYIINRKGMDKILSQTIRKDGALILGSPNSLNGRSDRYLYNLTNTYYITKPIIIPADGILRSTIHENHTDSHINRVNEVLSLYKKYNPLFSYDFKQINFTNALYDISNFLNSLNIPYRLSSGTMLGIFRQNEFISYDHDIDLEVLIEDYKPSMEKSTDTLKLKKKLGTLEKGYELTFLHKKTKISIDIFFLYTENDYRWFASYYGRCNKAKYKMCRYKIPKEDTENISFSGLNFPISKNPEKYLEALYGPNWNLPKKYSYTESLTSYNYGIMEEDFPEKFRLKIPNETQKINLWPRKISSIKKPIIWLYWQNKSANSIKPPYLNLCLKTVKKHCEKDFEIIVLDDNIIPAVLKNIHHKFTNIEPLAMRADYIRFCLLEEHGGIWLDCDIVVQQNLMFMIKDLEAYNFIAFEHDKNDISIGIICGNKNNRYSKYMKILFESNPKYNKWKHKKYTINWAEPTNDAKSFLGGLRNMYTNEIKTYPAKMVYPIDWKNSKSYYCSNKKLDPEISKLPLVYLHNKMYDNNFKSLSEDEVLYGTYCMSELFRNALDIEERISKNIFSRFNIIPTKHYDHARSGLGSESHNNKEFGDWLVNFIYNTNSKSILEVSSGHWRSGWQKDIIWPPIDYYGIDILPEVVKDNILFANNHNSGFKTMIYKEGDMTTDNLPQSDILFTKDTLIHLNNKQIHNFLKYNVFVLPYKYKYIIFVHDISEDPLKTNKDIVTGDFRPLDLSLHPFYLKTKRVFTFTSNKEKVVELLIL